MFNNSANHHFTSGILSFIHGNQYNICQGSHHLAGTQAPEKEWKVKLYREYDRIPAGRIKILKTIAQDREHSTDGTVINALKVSHLANLVGEEESHPSLCVSYVGRDAQKAFKQDVIKWSRIRHANFVQLRGFNDSDIPMIVFQDDLIPVHHILKHHAHSRLALICYFTLQAGTALKSLGEWNQAPLPYYGCKNVWIQPRNGMTLMGPDGPLPEQYFMVDTFLGSPIQGLNLPILPLDLYNTNDILHYLVQYTSSTSILTGLVQLQRNHHYPGTFEDVPTQSHLWANTSGHLRPAGGFHARWVQTYGYPIRSPELSEPTVMEDGRYRFLLLDKTRVTIHFGFQLNLGDISDFKFVCLAWLAQACSFFTRLKIPKEQWASYELTRDRIWLGLQCYTEFREPHLRAAKIPCFLFVFPPPQLSNGFPNVTTWIRGKNLYYWSSDPTGQSILSESQCLELELPSLKPDYWGFRSSSWGLDVYEFVWRWQELSGFDPTTTDLALSLGYPFLEPISDEARFKVLSGDNDVSEAGLEGTLRNEGMDVDSVGSFTDARVESTRKAVDNLAVTDSANMRIDEGPSVPFRSLDADVAMEVD